MSDWYERVCAWCQDTLGSSGEDNDRYEGQTHGICSDCEEKVREDIGCSSSSDSDYDNESNSDSLNNSDNLNSSNGESCSESTSESSMSSSMESGNTAGD